jgi:type II secretory pathway pseudopilin PulG
MMTRNTGRARAGRDSGFTLVEALTAIVILAFGLIAITNLLLVASSSNVVANTSTGSASVSSEMMDTMKATDYTVLAGQAGGNLDADVGATLPVCSTYSPVANPGTYNCDEDIAGIGKIHSRWLIFKLPGAPVLFITVRSEGTGGLGPIRSRAEFTSFRTCTEQRPPFNCPVN